MFLKKKKKRCFKGGHIKEEIKDETIDFNKIAYMKLKMRPLILMLFVMLGDFFVPKNAIILHHLK